MGLGGGLVVRLVSGIGRRERFANDVQSHFSAGSFFYEKPSSRSRPNEAPEVPQGAGWCLPTRTVWGEQRRVGTRGGVSCGKTVATFVFAGKLNLRFPRKRTKTHPHPAHHKTAGETLGGWGVGRRSDWRDGSAADERSSRARPAVRFVCCAGRFVRNGLRGAEIGRLNAEIARVSVFVGTNAGRGFSCRPRKPQGASRFSMGPGVGYSKPGGVRLAGARGGPISARRLKRTNGTGGPKNAGEPPAKDAALGAREKSEMVLKKRTRRRAPRSFFGSPTRRVRETEGRRAAPSDWPVVFSALEIDGGAPYLSAAAL